MSDKPITDLSYLTEKEVIDLYEVFFGKILIKKPDFSYKKNIEVLSGKESFIKGVLEKLNETEVEVLKALSNVSIVPFNFINDKINQITNIPLANIDRAVNSLLQKKYIFLREDNNTLIIPQIYYIKEALLFYKEETDSDNELYQSQAISDINNLINYFISKELKFSTLFSIYKKDQDEIDLIFSKYSTLNKNDYHIISYFFSTVMKQHDSLLINNLKKFYEMKSIDRASYIVKVVLPHFFSLFEYIKIVGKDVKINYNEFKNISYHNLLLTDFYEKPLKINFNETLEFLEKLRLIKNIDEEIRVYHYKDEVEPVKSEIKISSNYNLYINADSLDSDYFIPGLFSDFIKYNKIVEYEITENSVKRGVLSGFSFQDFLDYIQYHNLNLAGNVESTVKGWFDKYSSYFFAVGTIFFCDGKEKGKVIQSLIKNGLVKAMEIKKDEAFLIPEEEVNNFFDFLNKSGINFYNKNNKKEIIVKEPEIIQFQDIISN